MSVAKATALLALGSSALAQNFTLSNPDLASFIVDDPSFSTILGVSASITLIYNATEPLFHEGAVYVASTDSLFVSSNRITLPANQIDLSTGNQTIKMTLVKNVSSPDPSLVTLEPLSTSTIHSPNGAFLDSTGALLWCAQGSKTTDAGIFTVPDPVHAPNTSYPVVTSFFGRPFNGPNDVVVNPHDNGTVWFTDPDYTYSQGLRNAPQIATHVYRHDPTSNSTRVVADGLAEPNGLAFSADGGTLYVTDASVDAATNPQGAATIYAFDVLARGGGGPFLANKRVFAFAPAGIPDGIKVDARGNVWSGTGAGVVVWDAAGTQLGRIAVAGGAANFGFGETARTVFVLGEKLLWRVQLG